MKRKKNKCGSKERWRTCVFTDSWRRDLPEETQQYRLLWKSQQDEDQDKERRKPLMTLRFLWETFIYCSLSPATFLSQPRPTFSLTFSWTSSPGYSVDSSNLGTPELPTLHSSAQPDRQTDRHQTHSPVLPILLGYTTIHPNWVSFQNLSLPLRMHV